MQSIQKQKNHYASTKRERAKSLTKKQVEDEQKKADEGCIFEKIRMLKQQNKERKDKLKAETKAKMLERREEAAKKQDAMKKKIEESRASIAIEKKIKADMVR